MESPRSVLKKFSIGTMIGIVSMIPGVSAAVLAVCFGIYERLIADIADITHKIREDFVFLMTIGFGILFGIILIAKVLNFMIDDTGPYYVASMMLFMGLILGQLPVLRDLTEPAVKPSAANIAAFVMGVVIMCFFLFLGASEERVLSHDTVSFLYMILIGVIFSMSHLAPGISGSTVLLSIGLLAPLTSVLSLGSTDYVLLVFLLIGILIGLIGFAKIVHYALVKYRRSTYFMIFGLTVGSLLVILKEAVVSDPGTADILLGMAALAAGVVVSLWFSRLGKRTSEEFIIK
ncbi:MAG: DUF368 domain-containing protein [Methanomassiliicoccaceae archaeon]|nr:DUF368 domain-containing protein [Methanomassiliicoccaceae archaeon]